LEARTVTVRRLLIFLFPLVFGVAAHGADLTVIDIPNAVVIQDGVLGGGQPDEAQLRQAADAGYRTIVNMRGPDEVSEFAFEEELVQSLGMEYVFLPFAGGDAVNEDNARKLAKIIADPDALPAMIHCRSGNRVGILFAAKAFIVDGLDADAAMEFGTASGMRRVPEQLKTILESDREP
jgi:uncharacterized protein (TIGR01244 family)